MRFGLALLPSSEHNEHAWRSTEPHKFELITGEDDTVELPRVHLSLDEAHDGVVVPLEARSGPHPTAGQRGFVRCGVRASAVFRKSRWSVSIEQLYNFAHFSPYFVGVCPRLLQPTQKLKL